MSNPGENNKVKPVIGILGGIGAGKSTVAGEFTAMGCALVDGDAIGHELLEDEEVKQVLRKRWGRSVFKPGGAVDRQAVAGRVFNDPKELAALDAIMQPRIRRRMEQQIAAFRSDPKIPAVVMDAAIMFEAGWDDLCTHLVFVEAPAEQRAIRVKQMRGWDESAWASREKSQISLDSKSKRCYFKIENSSSISCLRERVRLLFNEIVQQASRF